MWIFTTTGFVSAVRNPNDRTIIVRSRDRASLQTISDIYKKDIKGTPFSDYPYRIELPQDDFAAWVRREASEIDYGNFKSTVQITRGQIFSNALSKVWSIMHNVEDKGARKINEIT